MGEGDAARKYLAAFNRTIGAPTRFAPGVNGPVWSIATSPDGKWVAIGGDFTAVNGQPRQHVALFSVATGNVMGERLTCRITNASGKHKEKLARSLDFRETIVPLLPDDADPDLDGTAPAADVVARLVRFAGERWGSYSAGGVGGAGQAIRGGAWGLISPRADRLRP